MRSFLIALIVAAGITYALDAYFFRGLYYGGLKGMMSSITRQFH